MSFDFVVSLLPKALRPAAKAVVPSLLILGGVVAEVISSGKFDQTALIGSITGVVVAVVTFFVPNK